MTAHPRFQPFADALRRLRQDRDLSRVELARRLGMEDTRKISAWESTEYQPRPEMMDLLDEVLDAKGELHLIRGLTPPGPLILERLEKLEAEQAKTQRQLAALRRLLRSLSDRLPDDPGRQ